jgi:hypothetical protein
MALDTYSGLKSAISDHLDRDDLVSQVDDFIDLAEARHKRDVRIREMIDREFIVVFDRFLELPTGYLDAITIRLLTDPVTVLNHVSPHEMNRVRRETTGKPSRFTVHGEIEFDVSPDGSYDGELVFYKALTPLSDANATNALLDRAPDVYLYAALLASAPFLMNDERIQTWGRMYSEGIDALKETDRRGRYIGALATRVAGPTP